MKKAGTGMYIFCTFLLILVIILLIVLIMNGNDSNNVNKHDIDSFITNWFNATESGDPNKPFSFFADDAVLFATLSPVFIDNPTKMKDYFKMFINLTDLKNSLEDPKNHKVIRKLDNNTWGYYAFVNWSWKKDSTPKKATARMSFIIKAHNKNKLKILLLHSSVLPDLPK